MTRFLESLTWQTVTRRVTQRRDIRHVSRRQHTVFDFLQRSAMPVTSPSHVSVTVAAATSSRSTANGVLTAAQVRAVQQQRLEMRRRLSFSDVVRGSYGTHAVKRFLYVWTVVVILMGFGLLGLGLYLLYFQDNVHIAPAFVYYVASYTGLALALLSGLGLYGLQQQRKCVTDGRRNYALGMVRPFLLRVGGGIVASADVFALFTVRAAERRWLDDHDHGRHCRAHAARRRQER